jgi:excisionase family DNA binding protein
VAELRLTDAELDQLADRLAGMVAERVLVRLEAQQPPATAYTVATLAAQLGRSERAIRSAITRGELRAVRRGRGWVITAEAVADWCRSAPTPVSLPARPRPRALGDQPGLMRRALEGKVGR